MSKTLEQVVEELSLTCRAIAAEAGLDWEWDGRFRAALGVLKADRQVAIEALLASRFAGGRWDSKSIGQAPPRVAALAKAWGGLRAGQALYTADPAAEPLLFAAWWPWGGNTTFSVRIGCDAGGAAGFDAVGTLRSCFGL